ncbi:unnamed protein product [Malus baccata var. baccata]
MKRRFEGGPGGSTEGEDPIPTQPTKLRREIDAYKNKEKEYVKDSVMTRLTKVEAAQDSQTQHQLEEKNTPQGWLEEDILSKGPPICIIARPPEFPSSCAICTKPGHWPNQCPWRRQVPYGITQVGKGYVVDGRRAIRLNCAYCHETGTHRVHDCPEWNNLLIETGGDVPLHPCWFDEKPPADC